MTLQPPLEGLLEDHHLSDQMRIVQALAKFRQEWQSNTSSESLMTIEAPVGLLLSDIADCLELTPQERHVMLGGRLIKDLSTFVDQQVSLRLT